MALRRSEPPSGEREERDAGMEIAPEPALGNANHHRWPLPGEMVHDVEQYANHAADAEVADDEEDAGAFVHRARSPPPRSPSGAPPTVRPQLPTRPSQLPTPNSQLDSITA